MKKKLPILLGIVLMALCSVQNSNAEVNDPILKVLQSELEREFKVLNQQSPAVYYLDYRVEDHKVWYVNATFGNLASSDSLFNRTLSPNLRVGSPEFDNSHVIKGERNRLAYSVLLL